MRHLNHFFLYILFVYLNFGTTVGVFFETATIAYVGVAGLASWLGYNKVLHCKLNECCTEENIPLDTQALRRALKEKLYGQHIATKLVYSSIHSHVNHDNPRKPLVLSFHGLPGTGKNYVASMIANALFTKGEKSEHFYFFNGRGEYPYEHSLSQYKAQLKEKITTALKKCERSVFVFDEVDKMPHGLLDVLVPFFDYSKWRNENKNKAIFIFLSNTGSEAIVNQMLTLWQKGFKREDITLQDFEMLITLGAFNEEGGFYRSDTIESKLIDHHIPFLPLEKVHVEQCIKDIFKHWGVDPTPEMVKEAISNIIYGPQDYYLYSTSGCKRLDHKVTSIIFKTPFEQDNSDT